MNITQQGAVCVNGYNVVYRNDEIACLELDLKSKHIDTPIVGNHIYKGVSIPTMVLSATADTLYLDERHPREAMTLMEFPEFEDWEIFCCDGPYRYTVRLVLLKRANDAAR